ncbi:unnamed protein product [Arabidopsis thaliana]|jgi:hypothetical protein|uniref:At3g52220 n=4 Tax=Arabidopsis TaxID=3701 RepID=Q94JX8_ARATH|nr:leukocyte immunoglobulin-like receptor family A protein [Arabidopsis thaliana]KAG7628216.1 Multiple myeloma tumor-associated protein 2-like N-terminal [Arabidopsis thaliana x Arabidopsis arenosa]KAG7634126.1 Multiple myeloma tumor-associated protein 2-like N-terminal [Arabidopsis suecica]AAK48974.1 putative protein [Arabidopsis thaliana]AAP13387.1 At3g52220 [Arabidopsis thaliana]AEE78917.1 leukocyte immunoglobulin-like receptor family A protein [Arabidopsis thaliana]|eukprot:NP_566962.1 leukocyte immunoglobulin-like receptor family A protein [Arabidopsis thaliana]
MYHPTRGGVRGGRDQFSWDEVKADKYRENYLGHSIKAPVGRWQKGKDLHWYARDKKQKGSEMDAMKEEIQRVKEQEEQAMREALGLAPKSSTRPQGNRLDKQEFTELVKRGSTAEDLGAGNADAVWVHGLGYAKAPRPWEDPSTLASSQKEDADSARLPADTSGVKTVEDGPDDVERDQKKDRREERKPAKREKEERHDRREKRERHEKRSARDSDDRKKHKKEKKEKKRRHDSDSD